MTPLPQRVLQLPLHERAIMAFKAAVAKVIEENARLGLPVVIWRDGKVVEVSAKKLLAQSRRKAKRARAIRKGRTAKTRRPKLR